MRLPAVVLVGLYLGLCPPAHAQASFDTPLLRVSHGESLGIDGFDRGIGTSVELPGYVGRRIEKTKTETRIGFLESIAYDLRFDAQLDLSMGCSGRPHLCSAFRVEARPLATACVGGRCSPRHSGEWITLPLDLSGASHRFSVTLTGRLPPVTGQGSAATATVAANLDLVIKGHGVLSAGNRQEATLQGRFAYQEGTLHVQTKRYRRTKAPDTIVTLVTATDADGVNIPVRQAAILMGYDHFNFTNRIVSDTDLDIGHYERFQDYLHRPVSTPTYDSPPGGWRYQQGNDQRAGRQVQDLLPFYWDEEFDMVNGRLVSRPAHPDYLSKYTPLTELPDTLPASTLVSDVLQLSDAQDALGYVFHDSPANLAYLGETSFVTSLVGVRPGCGAAAASGCRYQEILGTQVVWDSKDDDIEVHPSLSELKSADRLFDEVGLGEYIISDVTTQDDFYRVTHLTPGQLAAMGGDLLAPQVVPEPQAFAMLLSGCAGLALLKRRLNPARPASTPIRRPHSRPAPPSPRPGNGTAPPQPPARWPRTRHRSVRSTLVATARARRRTAPG